jgi:tetratricopeptide (TPR) repeat protein
LRAVFYLLLDSVLLLGRLASFWRIYEHLYLNFSFVYLLSRSKQQILLLDCCYSGAFGRTKEGGNSVHIGDIFKGEGRAILTASDEMQYAFEGDKIEGVGVHSIFTKALVNGIETGNADLDKDGLISTDELYDYIYEEVMNQKPEQTPQKGEIGMIKGKIIIAFNKIRLQEIAWQENSLKLISLSKIDNNSTTEKNLNEINKLLSDASMSFLEKKSLIGSEFLDLAESLFKSLKYAEGCEAFDLAAKLDEENSDYYAAQKGNAFAYLGNFDEAHIAYLEALEKNPKNWLAMIGESEVSSRSNNLDIALSCIESALQIAPNAFEVWNQKGRLLLDLKLFDEAIESFEMALMLSPDEPIVLKNLKQALSVKKLRKPQNKKAN